MVLLLYLYWPKVTWKQRLSEKLWSQCFKGAWLDGGWLKITQESDWHILTTVVPATVQWQLNFNCRQKCNLQFCAQCMYSYCNSAHLTKLWETRLTSEWASAYASDSTSDYDCTVLIHWTSTRNYKLQWVMWCKCLGVFMYCLHIAEFAVLTLSVSENLWYKDVTSVFNGAQLHAHISVIRGHAGICTDNTYLCKD